MEAVRKKLVPLNSWRFRNAVASFRSRERFWLEVNHPVPKPVQVHRLTSLGHPHTDFVPASFALGILNSE